MIYRIHIRIKRVEGAIIRTLGLIERRGFAVTEISTSDSACEDEMELALVVESRERSVELLMKQIRKLFDVRDVHRTHATEQVMIQEQHACLM
ncbi:MAG: hypothetical protein HKN49_11125 [Gammaproteobacteria bacterium]|nr:hypothetical protein [Gammaproteobacteria bacterium]